MQEHDPAKWTDKYIPESTKIKSLQIYYMIGNGQVGGLAFYDDADKQILFASRILKDNWAKEGHDAVKVITLDQEKIVGLRAN